MYLWKSPDSVKNWNSVLEIFSCCCVACGRLHQTSVLEFPLSTSTPPPLIFHGHPVTRRGGKTWHAVNILGDFIFYVWVILGQTLQTDRVQFSCWCHDDSTIQCSGKSRDKDQGMRGWGLRKVPQYPEKALNGPSIGWKHLLTLSQLRIYGKSGQMSQSYKGSLRAPVFAPHAPAAEFSIISLRNYQTCCLIKQAKGFDIIMALILRPVSRNILCMVWKPSSTWA